MNLQHHLKIMEIYGYGWAHKGDSDPLDILELSGEPLQIGSVNRVSIFGCLPLVDQGELDWKILAIRSDHPLAVN